MEDTFSPAVPNPRRQAYWFELDPATRTLLVRLNILDNEGTESLAEFTRRLSTFVEQSDFDRFVIDLRNNPGGNSQLSRPLADLVAGSPKINRRGHLFCIVGRKTYSAAVNFATFLQLRSKTLFVGEPSGEGPTQFGDHQGRVRLANTGLDVMISVRYWQGRLAEDRPPSIEPDLPVSYSPETLREGRDPAMEVIHAYSPGPFLPAVAETIGRGLAGSYFLPPYYRVTLGVGSEGQFLEIDDSFPLSLFKVQTLFYPVGEGVFGTDIRGVFLRRPEAQTDGSAWALDWKGTTAALQAMDADFEFPGDLF